MAAPLFSIVDTADGRGLRTVGLRAAGFSDLLCRVEPELRAGGREMLEILARYQIDTGTRIAAGEKVQHGYWMLEMHPDGGGGLEVWESTADGADFRPGADLTLRYWTEQHVICGRADTTFEPPSPAQKVSISVGVLEGQRPLEGVRYPAPPHMSGWYLTTDTYSGDIKDLRVEHLYHVTAKRPELARYLALPPGFRFNLSKTADEVFFDRAVLKD